MAVKNAWWTVPLTGGASVWGQSKDSDTWWDPFSWGRRDPSIMTKEIIDPTKASVANKMSDYLAGEIGKGLPSYTSTGGKLSEEFDPQAFNRYQEFLSLNAGDWFDKYVSDPTVKQWKRDLLPVIEEGYAGNLRGSGRYGAVSDEATKLMEDLSAKRGQALVDIPKAQFEMASSYKQMKDADFALAYKDWYTSLPETNPALQQSLAFLNEATSTGKTVLDYMDPGQEGWFLPVMESIAKVAIAAA